MIDVRLGDGVWVRADTIFSLRYLKAATLAAVTVNIQMKMKLMDESG